MESRGHVLPSFFKKYNSRVADLFNKENAEKSKKSGIYLGEKKCKICHEPFWKQWSVTRHSTAWNTLEARGKINDPDCVPCHSTGFGLEGGFISASITPDLKGVQCEQCHGPGGAHLKNYEKRLKPLSEKKCLKCHNMKHSPGFNYKKYFYLIKH